MQLSIAGKGIPYDFSPVFCADGLRKQNKNPVCNPHRGRGRYQKKGEGGFHLSGICLSFSGFAPASMLCDDLTHALQFCG